MANAIGIELEGKYVILSRQYYKGETPIERMFKCEGGFGCSADTIGTAIFGHFTIDGEECRIEGYKVERLATADEIKQAKVK